MADGTVKCIEDEIPFELPEGWEWERLGNVSTIARGGSPRPIDEYITDSPDGLNWIKIGDTEKDGKYIFSTKEKIRREGLSKTRLVHSGDFLLTNSMSFGRPYILRTDGCIHDGWLVIGNIENVFNQDFLYYGLSSDFMYSELSLVAAGSTVKNLKSDSVKNVLFPVPPLLEQKRIAVKLEALISLVDKINNEKDELSSVIDLVKKHILDSAICGKLIPQNPDDEPASALLARIRGEKEELIKHGKIKRDKRESIIFRGDDNSYYEKIGDEVSCIDDELPYDIPEGWVWCELQQCCVKEIKRGRSPKYAEKGQVLSFAQKCNQKDGGINIGLALWIDDATIGRYSEDEYMRDGDIIINSTGTGTLGRVGVYHSSDNPSAIPIVPDSHVTVVRASGYVHPAYLYFCLKAMQSSIENMGEGSTNQKELKPLTVQQLRIPLPPYAEQIMICKRVHTMLTTVSMIEAELR